MMALCLMLSMTYYVQNYAGIIGGSLITETAVASSIQANTTLGKLELHDCKFHSKGLENVNDMLMINKFLDRVSILYYDDDDDAALIVVF